MKKKHLYEVSILRGRSHSEHGKFLTNVMDLIAKSPDFAGINNVCLIAHHMDQDTVHLLCTDRMRKKKDVEVVEITKSSLVSSDSHHAIYTQLINDYFIPHNDFENL